jgi:hypothetical protein
MMAHKVAPIAERSNEDAEDSHHNTGQLASAAKAVMKNFAIAKRAQEMQELLTVQNLKKNIIWLLDSWVFNIPINVILQ